jgi:hypothetical protein
MEFGEFIITCMLLISITLSQILHPFGKYGMKIKIEVQKTIGKIDTFFISINIKCCGILVSELNWQYKRSEV